jgi:hypothetical protein
MTKRVAIRESKIEDYFCREVEKAGGRVDKFTSPGRRGVPDRLVTWPRGGWAKMDLVELKTVGGALDPLQIQDHRERKALGCIVRVIWTKRQVDEYVAYNRARTPSAADVIAKARTSTLSEFKDYVEGAPCRPGFGGE